MTFYFEISPYLYHMDKIEQSFVSQIIAESARDMYFLDICKLKEEKKFLEGKIKELLKEIRELKNGHTT